MNCRLSACCRVCYRQGSASYFQRSSRSYKNRISVANQFAALHNNFCACATHIYSIFCTGYHTAFVGTAVHNCQITACFYRDNLSTIRSRKSVACLDRTSVQVQRKRFVYDLNRLGQRELFPGDQLHRVIILRVLQRFFQSQIAVDSLTVAPKFSHRNIVLCSNCAILPLCQAFFQVLIVNLAGEFAAADGDLGTVTRRSDLPNIKGAAGNRQNRRLIILRVRFCQHGSRKIAVHNLVLGFAERIENSTPAGYADGVAIRRVNGRVTGPECITLCLEGAAGHRDRSKRGIDARGLRLDRSARNGNGCGIIIRIDGGRRTICRFLSDLAALHGKTSCAIDINRIPAVHGVFDLAICHGQPGRRIDKRRMATTCSVDHSAAGKGGCAGGIQMERIAHGRSIF